MSQSNHLVLCHCIHLMMEAVWGFSSGDICIPVTAELPQYAKVAGVDRSHPGSHILSDSWEMPEVLSHSASAQHQVSIYYGSLGLRNKMCLYTRLLRSSGHILITLVQLALSSSDIPGPNIYDSTRTAQCLSGYPCPVLYSLFMWLPLTKDRSSVSTMNVADMVDKCCLVAQALDWNFWV